MSISRGLAALIFIFIFHTSLFSQYLYKDEVVNNPKFNTAVNKLGSELYEKTGISLRLIMLRDLPNEMNIVQYQEKVIQEFSGPTILLTFAELNGKVDIMANEPSLYEYFKKKQVLSPVASTAQAIAMAIFFADDVEDFQDLLKYSGGTILPLLANKTKAGKHVGKYSAAMYNGYLDIGEQIAKSKDVSLSMATGDSSENIIFGIKIIFYSIILLAIFMIVKNKFFLKGKEVEV